MARKRSTYQDKLAHHRMVEKTKRNATRTGQRWTDDDVSIIMRGIERDDTTYNMAIESERSYYAVQTARAHIRFAMDHSAVLYGGAPAKKAAGGGSRGNLRRIK